MMKNNKELFRGVIPSKNINGCVVYKTVKKGQKSFRITSVLLQNMIKKSVNIGKSPLLILSIPANDKERYVLRCHITKEKN